MTTNELKEQLLIASNQYYIGSSNIEVNDNVLKGLIKRALSVYGKYRFSIQRVSKDLNIGANRLKTVRINGNDRVVKNIRGLFYVIPERGADPIDITEYSYNKNSGQLFTRRPGSFIIEVMVPPILDEITFDDYEFMDLILGLYLMYVGSVRKGFSLTDLPFDNDGGDLYENGKTLYEEAIARLQESDGSWYNAIL